MNDTDIIKSMNTAIIRWYPFKNGSSVLIADSSRNDDPSSGCRRNIADYLLEAGYVADVRTMDELCDDFGGHSGGLGYDYAIVIGTLEYSDDPVAFLQVLKNRLKADGRLLIASDNRFGIRYFCGDHDLYTDRSFDGIENYDTLFESDRQIIGARAYSGYELKSFLATAGFNNNRSYSVFPDIRYAQLLYAEDYAPNEELVIRYQPYYHHPESVFLQERKLLNELADNHMLHSMANGYLIECAPADSECEQVRHVTLALDRGDNSMATIIRRVSDADIDKLRLDIGELPSECIDRNVIVEKLPLSDRIHPKLSSLTDHSKALVEKGIKTIPAIAGNGRYITPYVIAPGGMKYFINLAKQGRQQLLDGVDRFYNLILQSSEQVSLPADASFGEDAVSGKPIRCRDHGPVLAHGYVDMMPLNSFVIDDEFYFYDQEFVVDDYPAKAILYRAISHIYSAGKIVSNVIGYEEMLEHFGLMEDRVQWDRLSRRFITDLRYTDIMYSFTLAHTPQTTLAENRERISFSTREYRELFIDVLHGIDDREVIVFGTGNFAKRFVSLFKDELNISMLLDNNKSKQGTEMDGIKVAAPEVLRNLDPESYKLIICIRHFVGVLKQVKAFGVKYYGFFNPDSDYKMPENIIGRMNAVVNVDIIEDQSSSPSSSSDQTYGKTNKPYHIGYVAGVFDLFHIGHLNLLRRAKEQCDYLIVGIVGDEAIREGKGTDPVVPLEERKMIVEACRYVDEAFELPRHAGDSMDMWRRFKFDVQFSGSDYENDPVWLSKKAELEKHGATIVFFPYTESTSTTKRKEQLKEKNL